MSCMTTALTVYQSYLPAGQAKQKDSAELPTFSLYLPATQLMQLAARTAALYVPATQLVQAGDPTAAYASGGQAWHKSVALPTTLVDLPAEQLVQAEAPDVTRTFPMHSQCRRML